MSVEPKPARAKGNAGETAARWVFDKTLSRLEGDIARLEKLHLDEDAQASAQILEMRDRLAHLAARAYDNLTGWQTVQIARHPARPILADYLRLIVRDFVELYGDRSVRDDRAIVAGFGRIGGHRCAIVGHNKGRETGERVENCFGCAHPEGFRKALRVMKLAQKFDLPVVTFLDTPGAYPGIGAEERGAAHAIAVNLMEMARLAVPIVCVVIGEGGSGGALGIGVGDRVGMMRHAYYSVISPEGCASILFRDARHKQQAAELLHLRAQDLKALRIIDDVIPEPIGGAHHDPEGAVALVETYVQQRIAELKAVPKDALVLRRYERLRGLGECFTELKLVLS